MKIQILGTGCAKCNALMMATEKAAQALGLPYELEKVTRQRGRGFNQCPGCRPGKEGSSQIEQWCAEMCVAA